MTRNRNPRTQRTAQLDQELAEMEAAEIEQAEAPTSVQMTSAPSKVVQRIKLGWQIRADLKKACQQIALDDNMKDYEALEMLLDEALAVRAGRKIER